MHVRIAKLTIGTGTADQLMQRLQSDLVGPTSAAAGFVAYYNVKQDDSTVFSIRVFTDLNSLLAENQVTDAAQAAIVADFGLTVDAVLDGDVGSGVAYARTQIP
jgi:hypothetical protein